MEKRVENVAEKGVSIDVGVTRIWKAWSHDIYCHSLSIKLVDRTWIQWANIIFLFLHPWIGKQNTEITAELAGVNEHNLLGWLSPKKILQCGLILWRILLLRLQSRLYQQISENCTLMLILNLLFPLFNTGGISIILITNYKVTIKEER